MIKSLLRQVYGTGVESSTAPIRFATRKEFETGAVSSVQGSLTNANTAIDHLYKINTIIDDAKQSGAASTSGSPAVVGAGNFLASHLTGGERLRYTEGLSTEGDVFSKELTKYLTGAEGSEEGRRIIREHLDPNLPVGILQSNIKYYADLVAGKGDVFQQRWHNVMGPNEPDFPIFKGNEDKLAQLRGQVQSSPQGGPPAPSGWGKAIRVQ